MAKMLHRIDVVAPPRKVFDAIATETGLRSWWTKDATAEPRAGGAVELGFERRATVLRMRVKKLEPGKRVVWECLRGPAEWRGTKLAWELRKQGRATVLSFKHARWRSTGGSFAHCNSTWGELMHRLKAHLEGKRPGPHWKS